VELSLRDHRLVVVKLNAGEHFSDSVSTFVVTQHWANRRDAFGRVKRRYGRVAGRNSRRHNGVEATQASNAENDNYLAKTTDEHPKRPLTT
jgi:hypothetical protein